MTDGALGIRTSPSLKGCFNSQAAREECRDQNMPALPSTAAEWLREGRGRQGPLESFNGFGNHPSDIVVAPELMAELHATHDIYQYPINQLPPYIRDTLYAAGVTHVFTKGETEEATGYEDDGYDESGSHNPKLRLATSEKRHSGAIFEIARHEAGHAFDNIIAASSTDPRADIALEALGAVRADLPTSDMIKEKLNELQKLEAQFSSDPALRKSFMSIQAGFHFLLKEPDLEKQPVTALVFARHLHSNASPQIRQELERILPNTLALSLDDMKSPGRVSSSDPFRDAISRDIETLIANTKSGIGYRYFVDGTLGINEESAIDARHYLPEKMGGESADQIDWRKEVFAEIFAEKMSGYKGSKSISHYFSESRKFLDDYLAEIERQYKATPLGKERTAAYEAELAAQRAEDEAMRGLSDNIDTESAKAPANPLGKP